MNGVDHSTFLHRGPFEESRSIDTSDLHVHQLQVQLLTFFNLAPIALERIALFYYITNIYSILCLPAKCKHSALFDDSGIWRIHSGLRAAGLIAQGSQENLELSKA